MSAECLQNIIKCCVNKALGATIGVYWYFGGTLKNF